MGFLIRSAFGLGLLFLLIPLDTGEQAPAEEPVGPIRALVATREAVRDFAGICERRPDVCATASAAVATILARAKESLHLARDLADRSAPETEPDQPAPDAPVPATGGVSPAR